MDENVILFPVERIVRPITTALGHHTLPRSVEEIKTSLNVVQHVYVDDLLENMLPLIVDQLEAAGINVSTEETIKDGAFFVEAFRSLLLKYYNIYHPFQQVADSVFEYESDTGNLSIVDKIEVDINKEE